MHGVNGIESVDSISIYTRYSAPLDIMSIGTNMICKRTDVQFVEDLSKDGTMKMKITCENCPLSLTRRNIIAGRGSLPTDILFIGEGPGRTEDLLGQAFIGPAGRLLDDMCADAGLHFYKKFFTNVVLCHPTDTFDGVNREPKDFEVMQCMKNVDSIIVYAKPKALVLVGAIAEKYYGNLDICPVVKIQHPSFLLRKGGKTAPYYRKNVRALEEINEIL